MNKVKKWFLVIDQLDNEIINYYIFEKLSYQI